ncbi:hypothetical protein FA15DRAFT_652719 [Coprinopsis marcescibilis]|uniref:F-box domain-containing protein n=1 Tax=Coprinopsis marcescibilis TaxID=230819 RepID=A0A5C3L749_COPMA|nr:hypothetical protein FA15DRAFT_652719 [Coprinopsis marcescibilis]
MYVYDLDDPLARETLADLDNTAGAGCVRILHIRPYVSSFHMRQEYKKKTKKVTWVSIKHRFSQCRRKGGRGTDREIRALLGNLRNLKNLEFLDIQCHLSDDIAAFRKTIPPIRVSWSSYSSCLRRLILKVPLECYEALLSPSIVFPRLSDLSVYIFAADYSTNPVEPIRSALVPFINQHVNSLESISIITPETGTADLSPMFFNLKYFPRLSKLHLVFCALSLDYINLTGLHEFFSAHSTQLQDVVLHFNRMIGLKAQNFHSPTFFSLPVFRVAFPALRSLDLGFTGFRDSTGQGTISYVHRFRERLSRLLLNHTQLSIGNVARLTNSFSSLRYLEIFVYHLSPTLLDLLSTKLVHLEDLRITCICFSGSQGPFQSADDPARTDKFCAEMSRRMYVDWALRTLRTQVISKATKNLPLCKRALATSLPEVETIDGLPRMSFLVEDTSNITHRSRWNLSVFESDVPNLK